MGKVGILTFHYSNNYGGVLQALSLHNTVKSLGYDVEVINFIPSNYKPQKTIGNLGLRKNIFKNKIKDLNIVNISKKISIMNKYSEAVTNKVNLYRDKNMNLSEQVDENSLKDILGNYSAIIVGSDQVWNPSQRKSPIYFLDFKNNYKDKKISYAADSTVKDISSEDLNTLESALSEFDHISVRNEHSFDFVKTIINKEVEIVADPTLLCDFKTNLEDPNEKGEYILTYVLGEEIEGSHFKAIEKIKNKYGNLPVYSIKIPTMKFELSPYADKVFYDLDPDGWIDMFKKAKFIYTDSFHGVLFSMKYHKPFLAYYTERLRATRFIDLGKRYGIDKYIVQNTKEINTKGSLDLLPNYNSIDNIIKDQKNSSLEFLKKALSEEI